MASQQGYDGALTPVVSAFDKEQRARLEAITFARKLTNNRELNGAASSLNDWIRIADYIVRGPS